MAGLEPDVFGDVLDTMSRAEALAPESTVPCADAVLFVCGGEGFTNHHLFSAAVFRGDLEASRTAAADGLACSLYAGENGFELDEAHLQLASETYRHDRNLVDADATRHWLARREVSLDDFGDYLERAYWKSRFEREINRIREDYRPDPATINRALWPELAFGEAFETFLRSLAQRLALAESTKNDELPPPERNDEKRRFLGRNGLHVGQETEWASAHGVSTTWFDRLIEIECRYHSAVKLVLSPGNRARELESRRLDFWQVQVEGVGLATEAEAREAHLCVTQEGERLGIFSAVPGAEYIRQTSFLVDLPGDLSTLFLSARPGRVFDPMPREGRFWIYRVGDKFEPRADDPLVCACLDPIIVNSYFEPLIEQHIRWI